MSKQTQTGGINFLGLLAILFIGLKLTGHITWSWWWVLSPVWLPLTSAIGIVGFIYGAAYILALLGFGRK